MAIRESYRASDLASKNVGLLEALPLLQFGNYRLHRVRDATLNWLSATAQAVVLLDSIEALDLNKVANNLVVAGLLKLIGSLEQPGLPVHIRTCIPAEIYFKLMDLSSNLLKDFQRASVLHWHPRELLRLAAKRFNIYMEYRFSEALRVFSNPYDLDNRAEVTAYWNNLLPRLFQHQNPAP